MKTTKVSPRKRIVLVSSGKAKPLPSHLGRVAHLTDRLSIHKTISSAPAEIEAWLASDGKAASDLIAEAIRAKVSKRSLKKLVYLMPPSLESLAAAMDSFQSVAFVDDRKSWLPMDQLLEVLNSPNPSEFVVGGMVDWPGRSLTLYQGDFSRLLVPLSIFNPTEAGTKPDFHDFEIIDNGHAVRFGKYEAATDAIFYECDSEYRKRYRRLLRAEERSFGASLRRLRILRGLRQSDFSPLPAKTIARIERAEVAKPHGRTLNQIAGHLGVDPEEIESY